MNFSKLKLNEGIATSGGTQSSLDAAAKSSELSTNSAAERFNRKSIVDTNQDPFSNELSNDLFNEKDERPEGENTSEGNPFA